METGGPALACAAASTALILLDTSAVLWLERDHARARPLARWRGRLYLSPASLLELQLLVEVGRLKLRRGAAVSAFATDPRWLLDDPPSVPWFQAAQELGWTRDPFDRLLVAHARRRGWRFATADSVILRHLDDTQALEL